MANTATVDQLRLAVGLRMGVHPDIVKPALNMSRNFFISHLICYDYERGIGTEFLYSPQRIIQADDRGLARLRSFIRVDKRG
jgi:hypothetical protein